MNGNHRTFPEFYMTEKILLVDDESNLLESIKRQMFKKYEIDTALSGQKALDMIDKNEPYAVIISDMRMPEMDGITFLQQVEKTSPESVRIMLTGDADHQTAINAINKGHVFQFLTKPIERQVLLDVLDSAMKQYRLIHAEKELLQDTLKGTIKLLTDILSLTQSEILSMGNSNERIVMKLAESMDVEDLWQINYAVLLSKIPYMTLPPEVLLKLESNQELSEVELHLVNDLSKVGYRLLNNIPRLSHVAKIILYQEKYFDGTGFPDDGVFGHYLPIESRILKVIIDMNRVQREQQCDIKHALTALQKRIGKYDTNVLEKLSRLIENGIDSKQDIYEYRFDEIKVGYKLIDDMKTVNNNILLRAGHVINDSNLERLHNIDLLDKIKEPIRVSINKN